MTDLAHLRARIEAIDDHLVDLLAERSAAVTELWGIKAATGLPRIDPARERAEIDRMVARAVAQGLDADAVREVLARIVGRTL